VLIPESSDLGTQMHQPAFDAPAKSRYDGAVAEPHTLQGGSVQTPPGFGSSFPEGSVESGGQATAPAVL
jgi:hypothetical protein